MSVTPRAAPSQDSPSAATFASFAGNLTDRPLTTGSTFGGLDFLILTALFLVAAFRELPGPKLYRGLALAVAVLATHLGYLVLASFAADLRGTLAAAAEADQDGLAKTLAGSLLPFVPWNVPALAALLFCPWPEPVDTVIVGGRTVVEGGELVGVDVPALVERAEQAAADLLEKAGRPRPAV